MKTNKNSSFAALIFMMLLATCAKEKEETYDAGEVIESTDDFSNSKALAVEDWEVFVKEANLLIVVAENNIKALKGAMVTLDSPHRASLSISVNQYERKLDVLREKLERRDAEFYENLSKFDQSAVSTNRIFMKSFSKEIEQINTDLEKSQ